MVALVRPPGPLDQADLAYQCDVLLDDERDETVRTDEVLALLPHPNVGLARRPGTHLLPVQAPQRLAPLLLAAEGA